MNDFQTQLDQFVTALQGMISDHFATDYPNLRCPTISIDKGGRKYIRIVRTDFGNRTVHCFVRRDNGDILKAAGWKAPAKHARGNIFNDNPLQGVTVYGAVYL